MTEGQCLRLLDAGSWTLHVLHSTKYDTLGVRCLEEKSQKWAAWRSNFNSMLSPCTGTFGVISERLSSNLSFWDAVRAKL